MNRFLFLGRNKIFFTKNTERDVGVDSIDKDVVACYTLLYEECAWDYSGAHNSDYLLR